MVEWTTSPCVKAPQSRGERGGAGTPLLLSARQRCGTSKSEKRSGFPLPIAERRPPRRHFQLMSECVCTQSNDSNGATGVFLLLWRGLIQRDLQRSMPASCLQADNTREEYRVTGTESPSPSLHGARCVGAPRSPHSITEPPRDAEARPSTTPSRCTQSILGLDTYRLPRSEITC